MLLAAHLGVPCVTQVGAAALSADARPRYELTRALERGFREKVEAALPLVVTVAAGAAGEAAPRRAAHRPGAAAPPPRQDIPVWDLADLGVIPGAGRDADAAAANTAPPAPARVRACIPSPRPIPTLPAFDRILGLVQGSVKRRGGPRRAAPAEEVAQEVFEVLRDEGWLDHLRAGRPTPASAAEPVTRR